VSRERTVYALPREHDLRDRVKAMYIYIFSSNINPIFLHKYICVGLPVDNSLHLVGSLGRRRENVIVIFLPLVSPRPSCHRETVRYYKERELKSVQGRLDNACDPTL
jgi:hypothetical protein